MKTDSQPSRLHKLSTRVIASICMFGAVACIVVMAVGGSFPSDQHGTNVVVPRTGDVWQVGELHTVQWCVAIVFSSLALCADWVWMAVSRKVNNIPATNSSGHPLMAMLILSYSGGSPNSHVILGGEVLK